MTKSAEPDDDTRLADTAKLQNLPSDGE